MSLLCSGLEVPLSVENQLLALVAYHGLGNSYASSQDESDVYVQWGGSKGARDGGKTSSSDGKSSPSVGAMADESDKDGGPVETLDHELDLDGTTKGSVSVWRWVCVAS